MKKGRKEATEIATRPVHLPIELHDRVRRFAANNNANIKDVAKQLLEEALTIHSQEKS